MDFDRIKNLSSIFPRANRQVLIELQQHYEIILKHGIARGGSLFVFKDTKMSLENKGLGLAHAISLGLLEKRLKNKMELGDYLKKRTEILRSLKQLP